MPIYEFKCENCNHIFEEFQYMKEEPLKKCPQCQKLTLRKVIYPVGIIFKGAGWTPKGNN